MSESAVTFDSAPGFKPNFYFWTTAAMAAIVFVGFGLSYFQPLVNGTLRPISAVVHVHGFFYFAWMILLMVQSSLINKGNVSLHRALGSLGVSTATGLVLFAAIISIESTRAALELGADPFIFELMYLNLVAISTFLILFVLAMQTTRQPEFHRRFMLIATAGFIGAGINRVYMFLFQVEFTPFWFLYLASDLFIVAMILHDRKVKNRIHPATFTGGMIVVIIQLLHWPIAGSKGFESLTYWLVSLGGYGA